MSSQITLHIEDNEEIKVVHQSEVLHDVGIRSVTINRGFVQSAIIKGNEARYTSFFLIHLLSSLPINAPPYQFFQIQYSHHQLVTVFKVLSSHFSQNTFPFIQSYDLSMCSLFTLVMRFSMPSVGSLSWIALTCSPAYGSYIAFPLSDLSQLAPLMHRYPLMLSFNSSKWEDYYQPIVLAIALQYVFKGVRDLLLRDGIIVNEKVVMFAIGLSRIEFRLRFGESMSFVVQLRPNNVLVYPKDRVASSFFSK